MGYVNYTAASTTAAQAFTDGQAEIRAFNAEVIQDMGIIADNNAGVADKVAAYQFISDFHEGKGPYSNMAGKQMADLRANLLTTVDRQLSDQLLSLKIEDGATANLTVNGHQATALDVVQNWNNPDVQFTCSWQNTEGAKSNANNHDTDVPWSNTPLNDVTNVDGCSDDSNLHHFMSKNAHGDGTATTYTDKDGKIQTIPGGGIHVEMTHVLEHCQNHYDITASGSAQAIAGFTSTRFAPDPGFDFKSAYNQALADAGLATVQDSDLIPINPQ